MNLEHVSVRSHGFALWKKMESERGRVTLNVIAEETGLNLSTVRKFLAEPNSEIKGGLILSACVLAQYFRVPVGEMVDCDKLEFAWQKAHK
jgi:hypothetical protein